MGNDSLFCLKEIKGQDLACSSGPVISLVTYCVFSFGVLLPAYFKSDVLISLSGDMS